MFAVHLAVRVAMFFAGEDICLINFGYFSDQISVILTLFFRCAGWKCSERVYIIVLVCPKIFWLSFIALLISGAGWHQCVLMSTWK